MRIRPSTYFVIATLIFASGLIIYSLTYTYLGNKLLPVIIADIVLILAGVQLRRELKGSGKAEEPGAADEERQPYALSECWPSAAWICGFCLALYLVGFMVVIPLFGFFYIESHGRGWGMSLVIPVILTICIYAIL